MVKIKLMVRKIPLETRLNEWEVYKWEVAVAWFHKKNSEVHRISSFRTKREAKRFKNQLSAFCYLNDTVKERLKRAAKQTTIADTNAGKY